MLKAAQAHLLREAMQRQAVEADLYKILQRVAEKAIDPNANNSVTHDLEYADDRVKHISSKLTELGYVVHVSTDMEYRCTSLTVQF